MFSESEIKEIKSNILSMLSSTQKFREAADFAEFELKDSKLAVNYCIKAQDYVHALYLARSRSIFDTDLGMCFYFYKFILTKLFFIIFFLENLIKSSCLNNAQNLISDINSQNENFITLAKRLVEVKKENSSEATYGNALYS